MPPIGQNLSEAKEPLTMLLYGREGTRKSSSALALANRGRILVIDTEGGLKPTALRNIGIPLDNIETWPPDGNIDSISFDSIENEVFIPLRIALQDDPNSYIGVVIDSFSELSRRLVDKAAEAGREQDRRNGKTPDPFKIDLDDWGTMTTMMRLILRRFRDLGIHLIITALERRDTDDDGFVQYGPAVGPAVGTDTMGLVDVVVWTQVEQLGPDGKEFGTGTTRPMNRHRAKDRFGVLPARMISPTADRVISYIEGSLSRQSDALHQEAAAAARKAAS